MRTAYIMTMAIAFGIALGRLFGASGGPADAERACIIALLFWVLANQEKRP